MTQILFFLEVFAGLLLGALLLGAGASATLGATMRGAFNLAFRWFMHALDDSVLLIKSLVAIFNLLYGF
tara:strand:+ start:53 stop:259 length:207 start_codon:yes stop_codon:yes gene_type:complete